MTEAPDIDTLIATMAQAARGASRKMARCPSGQKNQALARMAELLQAEAASIKAENQKDCDRARQLGLSALRKGC